MSIIYNGTQAVFKNNCGQNNVESFLDWLESNPEGEIDFTNCTDLHTALFQIIVLFKPKITAYPTEEYLQKWFHTN